jgi:type IV secretory pathway TrbL component
MGQVGQMLSQKSFLGGLGSLEGSVLIGFASIIFSLAIAVIPFMAKRIVSGDVGSTAGALIGAAVTAITAGTAAIEGAAVGAAAAGAGSSTGASGNATNSAAATGAGGKAPAGTGVGNQPTLAKEESIREILLRRQATNLRQTRKEVTHPQLQMALGR